MLKPTPLDHLIQRRYPVPQADGAVITKTLEQMTETELDALIESERAAAQRELHHADALQAYADVKRYKTQIGATDV